MEMVLFLVTLFTPSTTAPTKPQPAPAPTKPCDCGRNHNAVAAPYWNDVRADLAKIRIAA